MFTREKLRTSVLVAVTALALAPGLAGCSMVSFEALAKETCTSKITEQFDGAFQAPTFEYFENNRVSVKAGGAFDGGTFACGMEKLSGNDLRVNAWSIYGPDGIAIATGGDR